MYDNMSSYIICIYKDILMFVKGIIFHSHWWTGRVIFLSTWVHTVLVWVVLPIFGYLCFTLSFFLWSLYCLSFSNYGILLPLWYLQKLFFKIFSVYTFYNVCQRLTMIYYFPFYSSNCVSNTHKLNPYIQVYVSVILCTNYNLYHFILSIYLF